MAKRTEREDRPREHVIEYARSGRSTCHSCGQPISEGELRLSEAYVSDEGRWARQHKNARFQRRAYDGFDERRYNTMDAQNPDIWSRFHHLACAAKHQPYKLKPALATTPHSNEIPDLEALQQTIERTLSAADVAESEPSTRDEYHGFIARLRETADDDLLLVFGDWLQRVGDPRGELVAIQHALETASGDEKLRLADAERKLLAQHRKQLLPDRLDGAVTWRRGFVHRLALGNAVDTASLGKALAHPSFRLVRELAVELERYSSLAIAPNLPAPLPATLRVLELGSALEDQRLGAVGPALAGTAPQLARLKLRGAAELDDLAHPALATLELGSLDATAPTAAHTRSEPRTMVDRISGLSRKRLPELVRLVLRVDRGLDAVLEALAATPVLSRLPALELHGDLTPRGLEHLIAHRRKLDTLDLRGVPRGLAEQGASRRIATHVIAAEAPAPASKPATRVGEWLVRHTRRPEWGIGKVIEELDEGLQVTFEHAGEKHVRNVELLEEIESEG